MTYSINQGTTTHATVYDIISGTSVDLTPVLIDLHDNTDKEVSPEFIRNSVLTIWSSSAFKQTQASQSNISYIGVDSGDTDYSNKDVKLKVYLGKRAYSGTYSYSSSHDIMTSSNLNRLDDVIIFNTKKDTVSNYRTRVNILAGTAPSLHNTSPYIQSQIVDGDTVSLDLVNPTSFGGSSSVLSINSDYGTVSLNNVVFPSFSDSYLSVADGKVLSWYNGVMKWDIMSFSTVGYIGASGSQFDILGSSVNLNNYSLDFTDNRPCPISIGDVQVGESFNSTSILEMLNRIVYPYLPPLCGLSIQPPYSSGYLEVGTSPIINLDYTITKRSLPTLTTTLSYMMPSNYPPITNSGQTNITGVATGVVITPITSTTTTFSINVSDGNQSNVSSVSVTGIYPYFYGFSSLTIMTTGGLSTLSKMIEPQSDKVVEIYGSGNLYFIYDADYPALSNVYDEMGNTVSNNFTSNIITLSSPTGLWASKQFRVYQWNNHNIPGPPSVNYQFKY